MYFLILCIVCVSLVHSRTFLDTYHPYFGKAVANNYPPIAAWFPSFEQMCVIAGSNLKLSDSNRFSANTKAIEQSCAQYGVPNNSKRETLILYEAIMQLSRYASIDARFILAIVLQESQGCIRAPSSFGTVRNPGLMQSHDGLGTCNEGGTIETPCPAQAIEQMLKDGVLGTSTGDGLKQLLQKVQGQGDLAYYTAARKYNSGSVDPSGYLEKGVATHCYVSDLANRLTGWVRATRTCQLDGLPPASAGKSLPEQYDSDFPFQPADPKSTPSLVVQRVAAASPPPRAQEAAVPLPAKPIGANPTCRKWYSVVLGDTCDSVARKQGITFALLRSWNPSINSGCTNLFAGNQYCVWG